MMKINFSNTVNLTLVATFCTLMFFGCKKDYLDSIDPTSDVSELSRALLINGANIKGMPEFDVANTSLGIDAYQTTASITGDNFLFVPFTYNSDGDVKSVYFYIEGSDNYWKIPVEEATDNVIVLNIGIPNNVAAGAVTVTYGLLNAQNKASNPVSMAVDIVLPIDYCNDGNILGAEEGEDGLFNRRYILGDKPGWVSIQYETFSIPDRVDIRYNNEWIRSTGRLLQDGAVPPIKPCSDADVDDGFVGQMATFTFYYNPQEGKEVDVYMSGCLNGGTAWEYQIIECPKEKPVLGVHSNEPPDGQIAGGHSWITFTEGDNITTYGLWPDFHDDIIAEGFANGDESDIRINFSGDFFIGQYRRFYPLSVQQVQQLQNFVANSREYSLPGYVCTSFAEDLVFAVTGEQINSDDLFNGSPIETPRRMSRSILELEALSPSNAFVPEGIPEGGNSCSFCF